MSFKNDSFVSFKSSKAALFYGLFLGLLKNNVIIFHAYSLVRFVKMYTSRNRIHKDKGAEPTEFEESVAQVRYAAVYCVLYSWNCCYNILM